MADLDARQFEVRFRELLESHEKRRANDGCVECHDSTACTSCTFCRHSHGLVRCHYCVECEQCTDSSHCQGSRALLSCHHCMDTQSSISSSYLMRCAGMAHCTYCMGCVGLTHKDFHILNQPYDRSTYFELSRKLLRQLGHGA